MKSMSLLLKKGNYPRNKMHAIFIPYGIKSAVDRLIADMTAQKFLWTLTHPDGSTKKIWVQGSVRILPFGMMEYVFPKEYANEVLSTLEFHKLSHTQYKHIGKYIAILRRLLRAEKVPEFKLLENVIPWIKDDVAIFPVGVRYDGEMTEEDGPNKGWSHEAL